MGTGNTVVDTGNVVTAIDPTGQFVTSGRQEVTV
jgi:hypothetical protein